MRTKITAAIVTLALTGAIAFSVIGQEEPLPLVVPKANPEIAALAEPAVVLAAEPIREYQPPTLVDAARHNDYITFEALYSSAKRRGEDVSQFDTLYELWTYSVTDPIGAFYGQAMHDRLSRAYPGFAAYIADLRIVDDRGTAFYPTSETRAFLLDRALEGRRSPRVLVAEARPLPAAEVVALPPVVEKKEPAAQPVVVASKPAATSAPLRAGASGQPAAEAAAAQPIAVAVPPIAEPVVIAAKETTQAPAPVVTQQPVVTQPTTASRGILLMIIGLIGVGLLALVLRTPREEPLTVIRPVNNVEPLRKPQATSPDEPRASGSAAG